MKNIACFIFSLLFLSQFNCGLLANQSSLVMDECRKAPRKNCKIPPKKAVPEPPIDCCEVNCCDRSERWTNIYLGVEGGFNWTVTHPIQGYIPNTDIGYCVGAIVGYQFPKGIALEFEAAFRNNDVDDVNFFGFKIPAVNNIWCMSWMGNILYEIPYWCWKPFAGGGIGYATEHAKATEFQLPTDKDFKNFTYQLFIGFDYNVWRGLDVGVEYKYLHVLHSNIDNHGLMADIKWYW